MSLIVNVPKVQTPDRNVNQLQQNIITSMQQIASELNQVTVIGEIKISPLTLDQFQRQAGPNWILCNGANCVGTLYNKLTGNLTVPTQADLGTAHYFIRIN